ncbi:MULTISPECIES: ImmA/IrrE family metallo-endopeptidase [unclassified Frigoribacterium]|uniref:helix-turn-helix domain-containing protein n=1 Tax=unclassified Frigoribacterium TaxID=2627005 RepID=UPI001565829F|nr:MULTISPECIES: XRE family transcriptional regulator [unclassified Frigoribacterium]NQW87659.1 ImmA/IrrE family metallo-endopeptidase [Frigoribacterium sp. VKM Ac-2860]NQX09532.1 ImmA/IrrE family metallo-endopeptidase [Frigoribacterium sp. VKM Ac-2859]
MDTIGNRIRALMAASEPTLTQRELAQSVGMTPDALSRSLSNARGFGIRELVEIATQLRTSVHWLATGEPDPFEVRVAARHTFDHETMTHDSPDWQQARPTIANVALLYEQVAGMAASSSAQGPHSTPSSPAQARSALTLSSGPNFVRGLAPAIENTFGIDVIRVEGAGNGYSLAVGQRHVVVIGNTSNWFFQNWSLAHELGHIAQSTLAPIDVVDPHATQHEHAANAFAAELLMPSAVMQGTDWNNVPVAHVAGLLWDLGVSTSSLRTRLKSLGLLRPELDRLLSAPTQRFLRAHAQILRQGAHDEITERMQEASTRRFPTHLVTAHRQGVEAGMLRAASLAWMLGDGEDEVARELAPPPAEAGSLDDLAHLLGVGD